MNWPFGELEPHSYDCLVIDWPWDFGSNSKKNPGRNARRHYPTLKASEAPNFPFHLLCKKDCEVFFWITSPFYVVGTHLPMLKAWNMKATAQAFTWIKLRKNAAPLFFMEADLHWGNGFTTRKNTETCLLARPKGSKSLRDSARVHEVIFAPVREHSRKPEISRDRIEEYIGPGRRVAEMFAQQSREPRIVECWDTWGRDKDKYDEISP